MKNMKHRLLILDILIFLMAIPMINSFNCQANAQINPDSPVGFGYKIMWIAIKTNNQQLVAQSIGLKKSKPSNWTNGIDKAYEDAVFITPPIDNWIIVVGMGLPTGDSKESIKQVTDLLKKLSKQFGEAQFFCTHRVVEYHYWIKSKNGQINRIYSYLGERGENIQVEGEPTAIEKKYNLINTFSKEAQKNDYYYRTDLKIPNEQLVMIVAGEWSINPTVLENRKDIKGLGLLGQL